TSKEQSITITGQSSLSKDQISQMVKDAEAHAEEDRQRKDEAEERNKADTLVYQTEKLLADQGDKIEGEDKIQVEQSLATLKEALAGDDLEKIKIATEGLMISSQKFSTQLYEQAAQEGGYSQPTNASADGADDDVVDAEVVEDDQ
ncbi:MAG TPA: molecular chaperone DnaK, partial [Acidimicrobiaceae bacterium]|nr:molecular chaperone DnaK [Acidimicrobiaceae bacterium]